MYVGVDQAGQQPTACEIESLRARRDGALASRDGCDFATNYYDRHVMAWLCRYAINQVRVLKHEWTRIIRCTPAHNRRHGDEKLEATPHRVYLAS
jgi:hypothetical protein